MELVSKQKTIAKKIEVLKEYENVALKSILIWNFDETAISVLPEGNVPFKPNEAPAGTEHTSLRQEHQYLYNFLKGGNDTLSPIRKETMFIQIHDVFPTFLFNSYHISGSLFSLPHV